MKRFVKNIIGATIVFFLIAITLSVLYIQKDPYADFGKYENYSYNYRFESLGDISTKKIINTKAHHDTFIFGNSRSTALWACYIQKKIPDSRAFHYANWLETIGGMLAKIKLLDSRGVDIRNVVMFIDNEHTFAGKGVPRTADHYLVSGVSRFEYLFTHYAGFFSNAANLKILFGGMPANDPDINRKSDLVTNDLDHQCSDSLTTTFGNADLLPGHKRKVDSLKAFGFPYERPLVQQYYTSDQISGSEIGMINELNSILKKHGANLYVIISPLYDQMKFSASDMTVLKNAFGPDLYDFSGKNEITEDHYNYLDPKHFTSRVSKIMIDSVVRRN
jgi:hypothetical protein